ncbi:MAG: SUMF1/EgtB/PvdO family nonheme iron enzyme [Bacteroidota bacterium]
MPSNNNHTISEQELDNLLKQAFLNLDSINPKNEHIMETIANHTFSQPVPIVTGSKTFFSSGKMMLIFTGAIIMSVLAVVCFLYFKTDITPNTPVTSALVHEQPINAQSKEKSISATVAEDTKPLLKTAQSQQVITLPLPENVNSVPPVVNETPPVILFPDKQTKPEDSAYVFPVLTEDEIKLNHTQKKRMIDQLAKLNKYKYAFIPMGSFIYGKDTFSCQAFYMQTTEVSNLEYRTFLFDLLIQGRKKEFLEAKPDQDQWVKQFNKEADLKPMKEHYFSHPAYNDYPVVNISKKGAEMYCVWLTIEANHKLQEKEKPLQNDLRIPTDYEWAYAASNGKIKAKYANGTENLRDRRGVYLQNYNCAEYSQCWHDTVHDLYMYKSTPDKEVKPIIDGGFLTTVATSYAPNSYGIYNMAGNVSEMVYLWDAKTNKAIGFGAKGGSWMSPDYFLEIDAKQEFKYPEKPSPLRGFRPVMTAPVKR